MLYYLSFRVTWSVGSVGRAHRSHRWGHWFESSTDHQISLASSGLARLFLYKSRVFTPMEVCRRPPPVAGSGRRSTVRVQYRPPHQPCKVSLAGFVRFIYFPIDFPPVRTDGVFRRPPPAADSGRRKMVRGCALIVLHQRRKTVRITAGIKSIRFLCRSRNRTR